MSDLVLLLVATVIYSGIFIKVSVLDGKFSEARELAHFVVKLSPVAFVIITAAKLFSHEFLWEDYLFWALFIVIMFLNSLLAMFWNKITEFCYKLYTKDIE